MECLVDEDSKLVDVHYSQEKVLKVIEMLRKESAGGPDEIPPRVLMEIGTVIAKPLAFLFRRSMDEKRIPEEWRDSMVVPIYKGGSKCLPKNYRLVNLTVCIMKLKERIDREVIVYHIEKHTVGGFTTWFLQGKIVCDQPPGVSESTHKMAG